MPAFPTIWIPTPEVGPQGSFGSLLNSFITWAIAIGALATLAFILIGGFSYITAQDDEKKAEGARKTITNGVIGLIIISAAFIIWRLVVSLLGLETLFGGEPAAGGSVPCTQVTGLTSYGIADGCYSPSQVQAACSNINALMCTNADAAEKALINTYCPGQCP